MLDAHVVLSGRVDVSSNRRDSGPFNSTGRTRGRSYREVLTQRTERVKKELMRADSEKQSLSFTDPANLWFQNLPGRLKCLPLTSHELRGKSRNTFTAARLKKVPDYVKSTAMFSTIVPPRSILGLKAQLPL